MAESNPHFQSAEPPSVPGVQSAHHHNGSYQSIRQLMSARREFHKRVEEARSNVLDAWRQLHGIPAPTPHTPASGNGNGNGHNGNGSNSGAASTASSPQQQRQTSTAAVSVASTHSNNSGSAWRQQDQPPRPVAPPMPPPPLPMFTTPLEFADDERNVEPSVQHDGGAPIDATNESLCVWKVNIYLRSESQEGFEPVNGVAPFQQRYQLPSDASPAAPIRVQTVIKFNAANPDIEAPLIRILAPRVEGPSLFHGVVCANDLANGEWSLRRVFDVMMALRTHLIMHCGMEGGGRRDDKFTDVEASDGATYIATLHPEWKLQSSVAPEDLARVRELVEAAAANSNQAAYLAQELQQRELQYTRQVALDRRPYMRVPPALTEEGVLRDEEMECMIRHLRELALQRLDEAAVIAATGETLQRRACALFALGRYTEAYDTFVEVHRRYYDVPADKVNNAAAAAAAAHPDGVGGVVGGPTAPASAVSYELAHCSLKLGNNRRAFHEALMGIRHSPPGPFASVLHAIATEVAKEELDGLTRVVRPSQALATKVNGGYHGGAQPEELEILKRELLAANERVASRAKETFTVLQQLLELSQHNPHVLGTMAYTLAISGDKAQATRCLDVAVIAAGMDPIGMAILDPPALTPAMTKVWCEHREMVAGWLQTSVLIGQLGAAQAARRVMAGLSPDPTPEEMDDRRRRIAPTPVDPSLLAPDGYDERGEQHSAQKLEGNVPDAMPEDSQLDLQVQASVVGHVRSLTAAVRDIFSAMDAAALVRGAGRCEYGEALIALQLNGFLNQYGPPAPFGSILDLAQFHRSDLDHLIAGRRTILPQHIDSLLDLKTVVQLRGELLGPALAIELRSRAITDFVPYQPQLRYDSAEFRRLVAMTPAASRQQYYLQVRNLVLSRMLDALQPTLESIARDKLTLDRQRQVWALTEQGGDITAAADLMSRGLREYHRRSRRSDDLNLDGPRWFRRRNNTTGGMNTHRLKPSKKRLEPYYDIQVGLLVATREANSGDTDRARSIINEFASRLATEGAPSCPEVARCGRCYARQMVEAFLKRLESWSMPTPSQSR